MLGHRILDYFVCPVTNDQAAVKKKKISPWASLCHRWCWLFIAAEEKNFQQGGLGKCDTSCYGTRRPMAETWLPGGSRRKWLLKYALGNLYWNTISENKPKGLAAFYHGIRNPNVCIDFFCSLSKFIICTIHVSLPILIKHKYCLLVFTISQFVMSVILGNKSTGAEKVTSCFNCLIKLFNCLMFPWKHRNY